MAAQLSANETKTTQDLINMGKVVNFNNLEFHLKWSANPSAKYFKQEYLQSGSSLDNYKEMITVDALKGKLTLEQALKIKIQELQQLKKTNPIVNYSVYQKDKSYTLDFIMTDGGELFEWNLYKYINKGTGEKQHLVLCSYTYRKIIKTQEMAEQFFGYIKDQRNNMIQELHKIDISSVEIK